LQNNFSPISSDLEKFRGLYNEFVSTKMPQQFEMVNKALQDLTLKSHELFVAHKQVLEAQSRQIMELQHSRDAFSADVAARLANAPSQHIVGLMEANNRISELQAELHKSSEAISRLKEAQMRSQQESVSSQNFSAMADRVSRLEFQFGEFANFKESAQVAFRVLEGKFEANTAQIQ